MDPASYPYKHKHSLKLWIILLAPPTACWFASRAHTNDRGVVINGLIHLGPQGATIFYSSMCLLMAVAVLFELWSAYRVARDSRCVTLSSTEISVPMLEHPGHTIILRLTAITDVLVETDSAGRHVVITHPSGQLKIFGSHLPDRKALEDLHTRLKAYVPRSSVRGDW